MAIRVSIETEVIRCIASEWQDTLEPPYRGIVTIRYLPNNLAVASAAHGEFTRRDVKKIYEHVHSRGASLLYAKRSTGHKLPKGVLVEHGPFKGLYKVVL